jgi:hypothetical protein
MVKIPISISLCPLAIVVRYALWEVARSTEAPQGLILSHIRTDLPAVLRLAISRSFVDLRSFLNTCFHPFDVPWSLHLLTRYLYHRAL